MKSIISTLLLVIFSFTFLTSNAQKSKSFKPREIYKSKALVIIQVAENSFVHVSFLQTNDFGNVPCNGLIVKDKNEVIVFDTPTNDKSSEELIKWIKNNLHCEINAVIPTHFHDDCLGGLKAFHDNNIPSYASLKTIELAKERKFAVPQNSFTDSLKLKVGDNNISAKFFGEGHTKDNVVGYFPTDNIIFGGCLIKEVGASKGFLGDANLATWSGTVENVKREYPEVKIVVPGHGKSGNKELLDYTIQLFKVQ
ncbi:subclass B1 metallo-beta-lactamase [Pollutibacter soli]|uniref:subclass B1 metallo-beta-lactamase n=1 Tax=Pollutibacter soli TaxID=3034157 RepID=UPI0030133551